MLQFTDQIGNNIELPTAPRRIVSLVPSQTELLYDLGLSDEVVGITRFCIHPQEWFNTKAKIGGTKQFNFDAIRTLQPDLIIGNKEENYKEGIEELQKHYPVWMSDIFNLQDALNMMLQIGAVTDKENAAKKLVAAIGNKFKQLQQQKTNYRVAYFIWRKPYMVAGGNTFIDFMLQQIGCINCFKNTERYPEVSLEELQQQQPDYIFLSSEPYSFKELHFEEFTNACPNAKTILVDGEAFSWYGSRLLQSPDYFNALSAKLIA
jgi:ABC-type Fe3+-hydroxamate transport system substrate-binding protein